MPSRRSKSKIKVGVSSCLLGEKVRWDGGHKRNRTVTNPLGRIFEWVPTCPEVEIGMGIPRQAVRLMGTVRSPRMVGTESATDWTVRMTRYARRRSRELAKLGVCGYIFKARSPSCGVARIPVTSKNGTTTSKGRGLFANAFMRQYSLVPVEDEDRLQDTRVRDNFITRVNAYHRLAQLFNGRFSRTALAEFHHAHRYLLMAHSVKHEATLAKLIERAHRVSPAQLKTRYAEPFMQALTFKTTVNKNAAVLNHMLRILKKSLSEAEQHNTIKAIEDYRKKSMPLMKPVTLIKRLARKYKIGSLTNQVYINSFSTERIFHNHV